MERRVSYSEFKAFRRCRRQWALRYIDGLAPVRERVSALTLGALTHVGLEIMYDTGSLELAKQAVLNVMEMSLHTHDDQEALRQMAADAQNFLTGYDHWLIDTGADQRYEHVASEVEYEMPLTRVDGVDWVLIGKLDRRVRDRVTGRQRYMDFKTTATFESFMVNACRDEQFPTYDMLLHHNEGQACGGGVWRMIKKSKRARNGDGDFFMDYETSFNGQVLQSVLDRYVALAEEMSAATAKYHERKLSAVPNPTMSCSWDCPFTLVCDSMDDGSRYEDMLRDYYFESDPYARYRRIGREAS